MYSAFDLLFNLLCFFWKWNVLFFLCSFISYGSNSITCQRKNAYSIQNTHHRKITIFSQKENTTQHRHGVICHPCNHMAPQWVCFTNTQRHHTAHLSLSLSLDMGTCSEVDFLTKKETDLSLLFLSIALLFIQKKLEILHRTFCYCHCYANKLDTVEVCAQDANHFLFSIC